MRHSRLASRLYAFLPLLIVLLTLITAVVGVAGLHKMEAALLSSAGETLELAAAEIAQKVDLFLDERARHVEALARTPMLRIDNVTALTHFLAQVRTSYPDYIWLGVMDAHGRVIASTDPTTVGTDRSRSQSFQRVHTTRSLVWEDVKPVEGSAGMDGVGWAAPIFDAQGALFGVIAAYVGLPVFEEIQTRTIDLFATRHGFLSSIEYQFLTREGEAFIDSDLHHKGRVNLKRLQLPSALLSESGQSGFVEEEHARRHVPVITGYVRTSSGHRALRAGWSILIRAEQGDVLTPIRSTLWKLILTGVFVYVPLLGFSLWAAWGLRREWVKARLERAHAAAAEANYRLLLDSTGEGIYGLNRKGLCTFVNKAAAAMLGYEPEDLLGKGTHQIIHHSHPDGSPFPSEECRIYGAFRTGEACRVDGEFLWRRDGTAFPVVYSAHPIVKYGVVMGAVVTFMDMTELKQAEMALRQSEERFRQIAEHTAHVFWMTTTDFLEILYIGRAYEDIWGRTCESLYASPTSWLDSVHPDDLDRVREGRKALTLGQSFCHEFRVVQPDGTIRWVRDSGYPIRDEAGVVYRFAGIAEDITERRQAAEALRASKELFHSAFDDAAIGIALVAPDGRWLQVNRALCQIVGYSEQEMLATNFQALTHPDDLETDLSYAGQVLAGEIPTYQLEKRYIHKLGHTVWILLNVSLVRDLQGRPIFFISQIQDITERKQAEEKLILYREIIANAHDPIAIMDLQGRFIYQNSAHALLVGFSDDELLGKTPALFLGEDAFFSICQELARAQNYRGELTTRPKDGVPKNLELSMFTIRDTAGAPACYVGIKHDVTERKWTERVLRALLEGTASVTGEQFFPALVQAIAGALGVRYAFATELLGDDRPRLRILAIWMGDRPGTPMEYDLANTPCENVINQGQAYYPDSVQELFPKDKDLVALEAVSYLGIALVGSNNKTIGHLCICDDKPLPGEQHIHSLLKVFASRAAAELERKRAEEALRQSEERLRRLLEEREQLSQDLHDNIIQSIFAVGLSLEEHKRRSVGAKGNGGGRLEQAISNLNQVITDVRGFIEEDRGEEVTGDQLPRLLGRAARSLNGSHVPDFRIELDTPALGLLNPDAAKQVLFITREAMSNSARHSGASHCEVFLKEERGRFRLEVSDDGRGFDAKVESGHGFGLGSMTARVRKLGGRIQIQSQPGKGTRIVVDFAKEGHYEGAQHDGRS